jgi:hypothetical protein
MRLLFVDRLQDGVTGKYFSDCVVTEPAAAAKDANTARKLWEVTERLIADADRKLKQSRPDLY